MIDAVAVRGRLLALELLKVLLENSGDVFRESDRFIGLIKQHLSARCDHLLACPGIRVELSAQLQPTCPAPCAC